MNSHSKPDSIADEQAALWAARLDGSSLGAAERAALDAWLAENPAHRALLSRYCQFSADLEMQLPALVEAGALVMPATVKPARRRWNPVRITGAAMAAAAAVVFALWIARPDARFENFVAPAGQRQAFTLADGTRVELNAHTNLQFANRGTERYARLLAGEAFFVVSKDKTRPFTVETPAGSVHVTGTTFDVSTDATVLDVTVIEGSVQVRPGEIGAAQAPAPVTLGAGDQLSASTQGRVAVQKLSRDALDDTLAWRQGIVVFVDEPLNTALARFARYQGRVIHVTAAAAAQRVAGRHSLDDLDAFLSYIWEERGIRTSPEPDGALRVSLRSE